jgi:hypothetical protein
MAHRVIQWATGNVGRSSLRSVLQHPELELAGVLAFDPAKAGRDAGELCRMPPVGVAASCDPEEVLSLDAECVLHMPLPSARHGDDPGRDLRDICRILASGKNVVTTVGYVYPKAYGPDVVKQLEAACREGGTSLHGTGTNPGWVGDLLPLVMSGLSARIDRVHVLESTDFSFYPSHEVIFGLMGLGSAPEDFEEGAGDYQRWLDGLFRESLMMLADGLAAELDDVRTRVEVAHADKSVEIAAGVIEAGSVAGQRFSWSGVVGGAERIVLEAVYRAYRDVAPEWPAPGCAATIEGRPRLSIDLAHEWVSNALAATALHAVHAVAPVCRAEPGIRTFLDLPLITGRHTVGIPSARG